MWAGWIPHTTCFLRIPSTNSLVPLAAADYQDSKEQCKLTDENVLCEMSEIQEIGEHLEFGLWATVQGTELIQDKVLLGKGNFWKGRKGIGHVKQSHLKLSSWHPFSVVNRKAWTQNPNAMWNWAVLPPMPGKRCLGNPRVASAGQP